MVLLGGVIGLGWIFYGLCKDGECIVSVSYEICNWY